MKPALNGFADELTKLGSLGALKSLGKFVYKHPMATLGIVGTGAATGLAAKAGYESGRAGGKGRYLPASAAGPSDAAYINYHQFFEHKPSRKERKKLHRNYREEAFKRSSR